VLPELQAAWQAHLERWPEEERKPADRSDDESGSWRGDGGQYLNVQENIAANQEFTRISAAEQEISPIMREVEATLPGTRLAGYENRLKGESRFKEKVAQELSDKPDMSVEEILGTIPDAIRYTFEFQSDQYLTKYRESCQHLMRSGCELILTRNYWGNDEYKGVNTRWITSGGQKFEVQFHTVESFQAKQLTHQAYERLRSPSLVGSELPELETYQKMVSSKIPNPKGVENISSYRKQGY
jgi:hypothetical protein